MATTPNSIITPQVPFVGFANLSAATGLTSRGPITGTTGLTSLSAASTNGRQVNSIIVKGSSTAQTATVDQLVYVWQSDGTTSWLIDEIVISAKTPSTTTNSFQITTFYSGWVLPATHVVLVSTSITTTAATTALIASLRGGDL